MGINAHEEALLQGADGQIAHSVQQLELLAQQNQLLQAHLAPIIQRLILAQGKLRGVLEHSEIPAASATADRPVRNPLFPPEAQPVDREFFTQSNPSAWQQKLEETLRYGGKDKFLPVTSDEQTRYAVERLLKIALMSKSTIFRTQLVLLHQLVRAQNSTTTVELMEQQTGYKSLRTQISNLNNYVLETSPWKVVTTSSVVGLAKKGEPLPTIQPEDDILIERFQAVWAEKGLVKNDNPRTLLRQELWGELIGLYRVCSTQTLPFEIDEVDIKRGDKVVALFNQLFPEWKAEYIWQKKKYDVTSTGKSFEKPVESSHAESYVHPK